MSALAAYGLGALGVLALAAMAVGAQALTAVLDRITETHRGVHEQFH